MATPNLFQDPNWPRASAWIAGQTSAHTTGKLGILGVPLNGSITPGRCDLAPAAIRKALERYSTLDAVHHTDLLDIAVTDAGDLDLSQAKPEEAVEPVAGAMKPLIDAGVPLVLLGGEMRSPVPV